MNFTFKIMVALVLTLSSAASAYAQNSTSLLIPGIPGTNSSSVGKAKIYVFQDQNQTQVDARSYIFGEATDLLSSEGMPSEGMPSEGMSVRNVKRDVLIMEIGYRVAGNKPTRPEFVYVELNLYFGVGEDPQKTVHKYFGNRKLTVYLDGEQLLSESAGFKAFYDKKVAYLEVKCSTIRYKDFRKMIEDKKVTLQFGETKVDLAPDAIEAMRDLNKTAEN